MQSLNRWCGIGRLGRDPEVKKTQTGISVCSFSIACERRRNSTQEQSETDWINCVAWRGTADALAAYAHKGSQLAVQGRLQKRSWEGNDGVKRYSTEVIVDQIQILAGSKDSSGKADSSHAGSNYGSGTGNQSYRKEDISAATPEQIAAEAQHQGIDISSDDLPF